MKTGVLIGLSDKDFIRLKRGVRLPVEIGGEMVSLVYEADGIGDYAGTDGLAAAIVEKTPRRKGRHRRRYSAATRKAISQRMKARWTAYRKAKADKAAKRASK